MDQSESFGPNTSTTGPAASPAAHLRNGASSNALNADTAIAGGTTASAGSSATPQQLAKARVGIVNTEVVAQLSSLGCELTGSKTERGYQVSVAVTSNFNPTDAAAIVASVVTGSEAELVESLVADLLDSNRPFGDGVENLADRGKQLRVVLQAFPPDVAAAAVAEWNAHGRGDIPATSDLTEICEEFMEPRMAIMEAVQRVLSSDPALPEPEAEEREAEGGAENRGRSHRIVRAPIVRRRDYSDYPDEPIKGDPKRGIRARPARGWLENHHPEHHPQDDDYQPPRIAPEVAELRRHWVAKHGEMSARCWLDLCRGADLGRKILFAPSPFTASHIRQNFSEVLGEWSVRK